MSGLLSQGLSDTEGPESFGSFSNKTLLKTETSDHSRRNSLAIKSLHEFITSVYGTKFKAQLIKCLCLCAKINADYKNNN